MKDEGLTKDDGLAKGYKITKDDGLAKADALI